MGLLVVVLCLVLNVFRCSGIDSCGVVIGVGGVQM